jgi:hypothetical protein
MGSCATPTDEVRQTRCFHRLMDRARPSKVGLTCSPAVRAGRPLDRNSQHNLEHGTALARRRPPLFLPLPETPGKEGEAITYGSRAYIYRNKLQS